MVTIHIVAHYSTFMPSNIPGLRARIEEALAANRRMIVYAIPIMFRSLRDFENVPGVTVVRDYDVARSYIVSALETEYAH